MVAAAKTKAPARAPSTGALIDQMWAAREEKRRLESEIKEIEKTISALDDQLMERMNAEGLDKATGSKATASITETITADVVDWDNFWAYVFKTKSSHLLQRRVSDPAYRELLEAGKKVPGVQPFTKKRINLRTI